VCSKVCTVCFVDKKIDSFCVAKGYADGRQNQCKECRQQISSNYRKTKDCCNGKRNSINGVKYKFNKKGDM